MPGRPAGRGQVRRFAEHLALLTVVAAVLLEAVHATRPAPSLAAARPTGGRVVERLPAGLRPTRAVLAQHVPPVDVSVPSLRISSRLVGLGLEHDGTLQVPSDFGRAGWYSGGGRPGDPGRPAVIVGHVDSYEGPGVFYRLSELRKGDSVLVTRRDGVALRFVVYATDDYRKRSFPAATVYAPKAQSELRLITCSGTFDTRSRHYLSNRVVFARLVSATPPRRAPVVVERPAHRLSRLAEPAPLHGPERVRSATRRLAVRLPQVPPGQVAHGGRIAG